MKQFIISSETEVIREVEERVRGTACFSRLCCKIYKIYSYNHVFAGQGDPVELARVMKEEVRKELSKSLEEAQHYFRTISGPKLALVIDGKCLMYALDPNLRTMLLNLSLNCTSVVCCRVSPLQKAQVASDDC